MQTLLVDMRIQQQKLEQKLFTDLLLNLLLKHMQLKIMKVYKLEMQKLKYYTLQVTLKSLLLSCQLTKINHKLYLLEILYFQEKQEDQTQLSKQDILQKKIQLVGYTTVCIKKSFPCLIQSQYILVMELDHLVERPFKKEAMICWVTKRKVIMLFNLALKMPLLLVLLRGCLLLQVTFSMM